MKKIILIFVSAVFICCNSVKHFSPKEHVYNENLNELRKSELGDRLALSGQGYFYDALKIKSIPVFKFKTLNFPHKNGDILPLVSENKSWLLYYDLSTIKNNLEIMGIAIHKIDNNLIEPFFAYSINNLGTILTKDIENIIVEKSEYIDRNCDNCYKQEFIFNGKVDNNLKFIYREYIDDFVRASFIQELQYDLNESKIFGFKGLRLEIVKASNTNIEYKILNPFNKI